MSALYLAKPRGCCSLFEYGKAPSSLLDDCLILRCSQSGSFKIKEPAVTPCLSIGYFLSEPFYLCFDPDLHLLQFELLVQNPGPFSDYFFVSSSGLQPSALRMTNTKIFFLTYFCSRCSQQHTHHQSVPTMGTVTLESKTHTYLQGLRVKNRNIFQTNRQHPVTMPAFELFSMTHATANVCLRRLHGSVLNLMHLFAMGVAKTPELNNQEGCGLTFGHITYLLSSSLANTVKMIQSSFIIC